DRPRAAISQPGHANGQRYLSKNGPERERYSDPDASRGHRSAVSTRKGGGFYGFKLHAAVDSATGLPVAWRVESARANESPFASPLVEREFGRLKNEWALLPLRVRGLDRVQLHADLTILAKLACALARARAVPLAA